MESKALKIVLSIIFIFAISFDCFAQNRVDLGLSVEWLDCNWGAKDSLAIGTMYKYKDVPIEDADDWRLPTQEEFLELSKICSIEKTPIIYNNVYFTRIKGINGNSILLPLCGSTKEQNNLHKLLYKGDKNYATDYMVEREDTHTTGQPYFGIGLGSYLNMCYAPDDMPMYVRPVYKYTYKSSDYCITKDDGTKYYIVIKQEKIAKNKYSEYVDAFVIKDEKKIAVSVYDGGEDLDDCGMEVQYYAPSNLEKGQAVIRYDEKEQMLYIPRASSEGKLSKDECNVFKFDGNMFVRVDIE